MERGAIQELASGGVHDKVFDIVSKLPGRVVLDTPAGHGALTQKLLAIGKIVTAGDIDTTKFMPEGHSGQLRVVQMNLNDRIPLDDGQFDIAVCVEGIEHLENQWNLVRNLHRVLKSGGFLVLSTPNIVNFRSRTRYFLEGRYEFFKRPLVMGKSIPHDVDVGHIAPVSYFELQYMMESCGFAIMDLQTNKYSSKNLFSVMMKPIFGLIYSYKNHRDQKRGRGCFIELYQSIMSDEIYYGETLIVLAKRLP